MYPHAKIVYVLLSFLNIALMSLGAFNMAKSKATKNYWKYALLPIISYTLYMGLRFGRQVDFNVYESRYYNIGIDPSLEDYEPLFEWICYAFNCVQLPYQFFILFCSFILVFSLFFFLKDYRSAMPYMICLFLWESYYAENYIRWYLGIAFFLLYIYYLRRNDKIFVLYAIAAISTHIGMIIMIGATLIISKIKFVPFPSYVWQILLILSVFVGSTQILSYLSAYVMILAVDERSAAYASQFIDIIEGDFGYIGFRSNNGLSTHIRIILAYSFPIYMIKDLIKEKVIKFLDANCYLIGIVIAPIFTQVEILDRISSGFLMFSIIVSGCAYWYIFKNKKQFSKVWVVFAALSLFCNVWPVISGIIGREGWWNMLFYWDANGRESLPTSYFR